VRATSPTRRRGPWQVRAFRSTHRPDQRRRSTAHAQPLPGDRRHSRRREHSAPWVGFTRAGCDFAGLGAADMELENDTSDLQTVFRARLHPGPVRHCSRADSVGRGVCAGRGHPTAGVAQLRGAARRRRVRAQRRRQRPPRRPAEQRGRDRHPAPSTFTAGVTPTTQILDEGDHFAGGPPLNPSCNGVTLACQTTPPGLSGAGCRLCLESRRHPVPDRAGRSPYRRRPSPGELCDNTDADALALTIAAGGPGHHGRARRGLRAGSAGARGATVRATRLACRSRRGLLLPFAGSLNERRRPTPK
jgi:hypothetical protein